MFFFMAQYKTHAKFNLFLALPLLIFILFRFVHSSYLHISVFSFCFAYSTLFMNPDLDLSNQIKLFSLRGFFSLPFRFYSYFFKHRGISHTPIIGSLTRIIWLFAFLAIFFYLIHLPFDSKGIFHFYHHYQKELLFGLAGIFIADFFHLLLD